MPTEKHVIHQFDRQSRGPVGATPDLPYPAFASGKRLRVSLLLDQADFDDPGLTVEFHVWRMTAPGQWQHAAGATFQGGIRPMRPNGPPWFSFVPESGELDGRRMRVEWRANRPTAMGFM